VMFQSTRLRRNGADWLMDGNLTMHGVTRAMTVPLVMPAPRRSPESGWMILSATSSFKLARRDFGITGGDRYNNWFNTARQAAMADTVDISIEVEGWWADAASQRTPMLPALQRVKTLGVQAQIDTVKRRLSAVPDSVLMDSFTGADLLVRELLEEDPAKAVQLASAWPALFKGSRVYVVYAHALAVTRDSLDAAKQYAEARRQFKRKTPDPTEKFPQTIRSGIGSTTWYAPRSSAGASRRQGDWRVTPPRCFPRSRGPRRPTAGHWSSLGIPGRRPINSRTRFRPTRTILVHSSSAAVCPSNSSGVACPWTLTSPD